MKKSGISTLKKRVWKVFSEYIRKRDCLKTTGTLTNCICITCHKKYPYSQIQAGHFIGGRGNSVLFSEKGVNGQCIKCNNWGNGMPLEYRRMIVKMYGVGYDEKLEREARKVTKFSKEDLLALEKNYKEKIKLLDKQEKR